jgi:hypothetical protein
MMRNFSMYNREIALSSCGTGKTQWGIIHHYERCISWNERGNLVD